MDIINEKCFEIFRGEMFGITNGLGELQPFRSYDEVGLDDRPELYPPEFLHEICPSGIPPHELWLKKGVYPLQ